MSFFDKLGDSFVNGIDRAVDSEFSDVPKLQDDRQFETRDSGTVTVPAGSSSQDFITQNKNMLLIGAGLLLITGALILKK